MYLIKFLHRNFFCAPSSPNLCWGRGRTSLQNLLFPRSSALSNSHCSRTLILILCWVSSIVSQYALLLNVGELAGDMFLNFAFTMLMEVPAFIFIYTMADRLGEILNLLCYSQAILSIYHNVQTLILVLRVGWIDDKT